MVFADASVALDGINAVEYGTDAVATSSNNMSVYSSADKYFYVYGTKFNKAFARGVETAVAVAQAGSILFSGLTRPAVLTDFVGATAGTYTSNGRVATCTSVKDITGHNYLLLWYCSCR
jgi:hypothetical protein